MNLDQLYDRMRTIKEKNERLLKAKEFLNKSNEESATKHKTQQQKKLPSPQQISDPDSTS